MFQKSSLHAMIFIGVNVSYDKNITKIKKGEMNSPLLIYAILALKVNVLQYTQFIKCR